jgi:hypothetical protein
MKKMILSFLLGAGLASAGTLTLFPAGGTVTGTPGSTVGWGFQLNADPVDWISISGVVLLGEDNPGLGSFNDFISPQGGPNFGALAPGGPDWGQAFDPVNFLGFGSYSIDPGAQPGDHNAGAFLVLYETFTDNPATCGACFDQSGTYLVPFRVDVVAAPEPGTGVILAMGIALVAIRRGRR